MQQIFNYNLISGVAPNGQPRSILVNSDGRLLVDGSGVTQPVTIATLPALASGTNTIGAISNTSFAATQSGTWNITNISGTVSLPTGASTSALQTTGNTFLSSIDGKLPILSNGKIPVEVGSLNVSVSNASLEIANDVGNPVPISDAGGSITVDGTFWQATQPVSAASLPLPSGAATSAKQPALGIAGTASTDVITVQGIAGGVAQPVTIATLPALASGTNTIGAISNTSFAATQSGSWNVGQSGNWNVANITGTVSLPTGAATSANQSTGNTSLASIDSKLPASLGAKAASDSLAVSPAFAATSTLANVASSATSVTLLAANNNRKTVIILNDSTSDLYIAWSSSAASTTNYSIFLAGKVGNTPSFTTFSGEDYSGQITGIWASANGNARITETS